MSENSHNEWTEDSLVGGHTALDFVNTAGGRTKERDSERLTDYFAMLRWGLAVELVSAHECEKLTKRAGENEAEARQALDVLIGFREALHACLIAEQANEPWPEPEHRRVSEAIHDAIAVATLQRSGSTYHWYVEGENVGLRLPLLRTVLSAEALLRDDDLRRMRNCDRCSWLFIDKGRGRPRRWCSMAACGSRVKSARYYQRKTATRADNDPNT